MATKWVRSNDVVWEELNGEALLVKPSTGLRWSLNDTAARVWKFCDGRFSVAEVAQAFADASGKSVRETKREIAAFCAACSELGLLARSEAQLVGASAVDGMAFMSGISTPPAFRQLGVGSGSSRRRPSPRGNSGPG